MTVDDLEKLANDMQSGNVSESYEKLQALAFVVIAGGSRKQTYCCTRCCEPLMSKLPAQR